MKNLSVALSVGVLAFLCGCNQRVVPPTPDATLTAPKKDTNALRLATDVLRQATEPRHFLDALPLLNTYLDADTSQPRLALPDETRMLLVEGFHLNPAEMLEVEANTFRPADAYYLDECFLLHDVARSLEIAGQATPDLARHAFRWVAGKVLLHEQGDAPLPPAFVLRRGYGSAQARAEVFLALMRQFQLEGCLLVLPAKEGATTVLVGLHDGKQADLLLFDPRLGEPVLKPDGTLATLKDAQQEPALLQSSRLDAAQLKVLQARLVCPLYALAPRMSELERILANQDRITLYLDPVKLQGELRTATTLPVQSWSVVADGQPDPSAPTLTLRRFLSPEEGGSDRDERLKRFPFQQVPWPVLSVGLQQLKLGQDLALPAREVLYRYLSELFERFDLQPHESLLRGQADRMHHRLDRIRPFLDAFPPDEADLQKEAAAWREQVNEALWQARKHPQNAAALQRGWADDDYLKVLLLVDSEENPQKYKKATLTHILEAVSREPLRQRTSALTAASWQDKAARADALQSLAEPSNRAAEESARSAWVNARGSWNRVLDQSGFGSLALAPRLDRLRARAQAGDLEHAQGLLEQLHLDLHRYFAARLAQADAVAHLEGAKAGQEALRSAQDELDKLLSKNEGAKTIEALQQQLQTRPYPQAAVQRVAQQRLALLARDWGDNGTLAWLRRQMQVRAERLAKAA